MLSEVAWHRLTLTPAHVHQVLRFSLLTSVVYSSACAGCAYGAVVSPLHGGSISDHELLAKDYNPLVRQPPYLPCNAPCNFFLYTKN